MTAASQDHRFQGFNDGLKAEMEGGTDRGLVLTCASTLEAGLEDLLSAALVDHNLTHDLLRKPGNPLNGLANRINMAFVMGLVTASDRLSLEIVRDIAAEAACGGKFEIGRSEHSTRINDAHTRSGLEQQASMGREKLYHITAKAMAGIQTSIQNVSGQRPTIRK